MNTHLPSCLKLTKNQVQLSINVNTLLDTTADCLRFVTEFYEVISQSVPHIYHSALQLVPKSSIIQKLYGQEIYSHVARVVTGIPASWDSCVASIGTIEQIGHVAWSPCGRFIAATSGNVIQVMGSSTLQIVSTLKPPSHLLSPSDHLLTFSPDGHLLACSYFR